MSKKQDIVDEFIKSTLRRDFSVAIAALPTLLDRKQKFALCSGRTLPRLAVIGAEIGGPHLRDLLESQRIYEEEQVRKAILGPEIKVTMRSTTDPFEFLPTHKVWLATSHKPVLRDDKSIWAPALKLKPPVSLPKRPPPQWLSEAYAIMKRVENRVVQHAR